MALATQSDVEKAIGADTLETISDDTGDGLVGAAVVGPALDEASSLALAYCAAYASQLATTVPAALRRAVVDIAVEAMREARNDSTEDSRRRYDAAMAFLRDVSKGIALLFPPATQAPSSDPGAPEICASERVWNRRTGSRIF